MLASTLALMLSSMASAETQAVHCTGHIKDFGVKAESERLIDQSIPVGDQKSFQVLIAKSDTKAFWLSRHPVTTNMQHEFGISSQEINSAGNGRGQLVTGSIRDGISMLILDAPGSGRQTEVFLFCKSEPAV